ncbi:hypothetical protein WR25_06113 isoform B [Diploscapter pachys]|nr:hypothetical protein WR25_06113 isoform B [Diploscapter pachys]
MRLVGIGPSVHLLLLCLPVALLAECPKGTFTCKDGSCIPQDWVGDGEPDCDDRSDEMSVTVNGTKPEEEPFDDIVTHGPMGKEEGSTAVITTTKKGLQLEAEQGKAPEISESNDAEKCPASHQERIDECSEPVILYIHQINDIYFENASLLADKAMQSKVEKGCSLMDEYNICITGASEDCIPDAGVQAWREIEVYICQLLLPAVREHQTCFERVRKQECTPKLDPLASPFCRLITSTAQDVACAQEHPTDCTDAALEMLPPIMEESMHIAESIRCRNPLDLPNITTTALSVDMSNAINSFYYIYDICSSDYSKSHFNVLAHMLCGKQDDIAKHSDCYQKTLEKMKCVVKTANTTCEALNSFNSNLDCAIVTMNEECSVEAQDLIVDIQEQINDLMIVHRCFDDEKKQEQSKQDKEKSVVDDGEFHLQSKLSRCTDDQENSALACLVELVEINKQLAQLQNLNFLLELASENSSVVSNICSLYSRYEQCLQTNIFNNGTRCSSASPLNTLARIGLAPICSLDTRPLLANHRECLKKLAKETTTENNCQAGLSSLGGAVNSMLQGIHGEALLCKSFYLIRETFICGEQAVKASCNEQAFIDLGKLKSQMSDLGVEEGCPAEEPANLEEIIRRPVKRPQPVAAPAHVPMARPLSPVGVSPVPPSLEPQSPGIPIVCSPQQQAQFEACVGAITKFQPHPLSVIKAPRQIDEACAEFAKFKSCSASIDCSPLWARGMAAMFEFACGEGNEKYTKIRRCLRDVSSGAVVSECVSTFSRGAPAQACLSANTLLSCAMSQIQTDCGEEATSWISDYVTKFATAIDPRCKLASQLPVGKVVGVGCSREEDQIIEHCAAPLNDIGSRLEELFQGGLQNMIKNVNSLAPVFAGGCNLTEEFRTCAHFLLSGHTPCVVSSCMIQAGQGICDQPDPTKAIDDNLSCLFGQIQEPTFAKCVRSTISTVKQFTLQSFRTILPKFLDCTEEIVQAKCGDSPIRVMRAMSSPNLCPIGIVPIVPINANANPNVNSNRQPVKVEPKIPVCDDAKKKSYSECTSQFFTTYRMMPISLISITSDMNQLCSEVERIDACSISSRVCAKAEEMAFKKMVQQVCNTRGAFDKHNSCLNTVAHKETKCMSEFLSAQPEQKCSALKNTASCMAKTVNRECGKDAVSYTFAAMTDYSRMAYGDCTIEAPSVSLETGCSEDQLVEFLECESTLDRFGFRPISIIT